MRLTALSCIGLSWVGRKCGSYKFKAIQLERGKRKPIPSYRRFAYGVPTGFATLRGKGIGGRGERIAREPKPGKVAITVLEGSARTARIVAVVSREFAKGTKLADVRKLLAKDPKLGGAPSLYLGTADPVYYRLAGLARPLVLAKGAKSETAKGEASAALAAATRKRRDEGVRWETLAASVEALVGRPVSVSEAKRLYEKGKGDLRSSYTGRGTRVGAPETYSDLAAAVEATVEA